jgi:diacylglycerol kinase family enzyme
MRTSVIINASAGGGYTPDWARNLSDRFQAQGMSVDVTLAQSGDEILKAARSAAREWA